MPIGIGAVEETSSHDFLKTIHRCITEKNDKDKESGKDRENSSAVASESNVYTRIFNYVRSKF